MPKITMNVLQAKEARRRAAAGESVPRIAADLGLSYAPVWCAVRGVTWSSIYDPPPLSSLPKGARPLGRKCQNCGGRCYHKTGGRTNGRCRKCRSYYHRHGRERPLGQLERKTARLDIDRAVRLYESGNSLEEVAAMLRANDETIRRRLLDAGVNLRPRSRYLLLSQDDVCQARYLVYQEGWSVARVVAELHPDVPYQTVYSAVTGQTWRSAPGPRPCATCKTITIHQSGFCWNCRPDKSD